MGLRAQALGLYALWGIRLSGFRGSGVGVRLLKVQGPRLEFKTLRRQQPIL